MQLVDKSGIACDFCGMMCRHSFDYYSWDVRHLSVYDNRRMPLEQIFTLPVTFSFDVCSMCFDSYKLRIIENYKKNMSDKRMARVNLVCDWTGKQMGGTYDYYYVSVAMVKVRSDNQPSTCVNCKAQTLSPDSKCQKCGGVQFIKIAAVDVVDRCVELVLCKEAYQEFVDKKQNMHKTAGTWAAQ